VRVTDLGDAREEAFKVARRFIDEGRYVLVRPMRDGKGVFVGDPETSRGIALYPSAIPEHLDVYDVRGLIITKRGLFHVR
jgi:hypothetical protein